MTRRPTLLGLDRNVVLLGLTSLCNDISSEIIYPLLPTFLAVVLGSSPAYIGLIEGIADSTASLVKLLSGWLSDRLARRKGLVVAGYAIATVARPLVAAATAPWHVLVLRFSDRAGKGLRSAPRDALLAESSTASAWGRSFGFHRAMDHLGAVIGPLIAFMLMSVFAEGYRVVFALASIPGVLALAVVTLGVSEPRHMPAALPAVSTPQAPSRPLRNFFFAVLIFTLGNSTDAFLLLRARELGVSIAALPLLWSLLHVIKSVTSLPGSGLSDRWGRKWIIFLGWVIYALVYLGFAWASTELEIWILFASYGLFFGLTEGTERALVADLAPTQRGAAFGYYHLIIGIAALPASVIFGLLWGWGGAALAFTVGATFAGLAAVLLVLLVPQRAGHS
ncbi:MAG: MFS transporter [Candidatus Binatia bacterium]